MASLIPLVDQATRDLTGEYAKVLNPKVTTLNGYDEVCNLTYKLIAPKNTPESTVYATVSSLYASRCNHSHDCCGCHTFSYAIKRQNRKEFKVRVTIGRNF